MTEEAKAALDLRLARGEISPEEYTKTLKLLTQDEKTIIQQSDASANRPESSSKIESPKSASPQPSAPTKPKAGTSKGCLGCLGIIMVLVIIGIIAEMTGANEIKVGSNGAIGFPPPGLLLAEIHLAPGTKLESIRRISDASCSYTVLDGQYQGRSVIIMDSEVPNHPP